MILTDTGPLVALVDVRDSRHADAIHILDCIGNEQLLTAMPCFAEAMNLLGRSTGYFGQSALWNLRDTKRLILREHPMDEVNRMSALMAQYQDTPMDLADASLVVLAEVLNLRRVFTFDRDFYIYRLEDGSLLEILR